MDEPRHGTVVSGEVIPPQTYLHKVAAAKRDDQADDDAQESTEAAPEDTTDDTAAVGEDTYSDADADEDDEFRPDTIAMPAASANTSELDDAPADTAESDSARTDTAATDAGRTGTEPHAADAAAADTTRPDIVAPEVPGAATPREGRPGDVPIPEDVSLLGDGAVIREQWMRVQASFVDDPRAAVSAAAGVITDAAARVETAVRERQQALRDNWDSEGRADTEALRVTMQQYRQLLERLAAL